jgi:hypothetical protein
MMGFWNKPCISLLGILCSILWLGPVVGMNIESTAEAAEKVLARDVLEILMLME